VVPSNLIPLQNGFVAWGDYDNDGRLDLAIMGMTNASAASGILKVRLI